MKSATGLTGSGSRDWFIQRVSAVVLAVYTVVILGWILLHGGFNYEQWSGFMMTLPMKILSLLAILSLAAHALSLIHISEPTRHFKRSRMPSSA